MKQELISVVIPIYNVEKYVEKCVNSVISQTYKNMEIILVDDGSKDKSGEICDSFEKKDKRIKVIHKKNGGLSDARNAGIEIAKGKYISFIDSDDYVSELFIERLYNLCTQNNADIAECAFIKFEDKSQIKKIEDSTVISVKNNEDVLYDLYRKESYVVTVVVWNKLYKMDLFNDIRFPKGKINEDEFTTYKLFWKCKKIAITSERLYYYRKNNNSIMGKKFNVNRYDCLEAEEERADFLYENKLMNLYSLCVARYLKRIQEYYYKTIMFIDNSKEYQKMLLQKYRKQYKNTLQYQNLETKIKNIFFYTSPKTCYFIYRIRMSIKNKKEMIKKWIKKLIRK